jgi:hypothetical protein
MSTTRTSRNDVVDLGSDDGAASQPHLALIAIPFKDACTGHAPALSPVLRCCHSNLKQTVVWMAVWIRTADTNLGFAGSYVHWIRAREKDEENRSWGLRPRRGATPHSSQLDCCRRSWAELGTDPPPQRVGRSACRLERVSPYARVSGLVAPVTLFPACGSLPRRPATPGLSRRVRRGFFLGGQAETGSRHPCPATSGEDVAQACITATWLLVNLRNGAFVGPLHV